MRFENESLFIVVVAAAVVASSLFLEYIIELECKDKESAHYFECKIAQYVTPNAHIKSNRFLKV